MECFGWKYYLYFVEDLFSGMDYGSYEDWTLVQCWNWLYCQQVHEEESKNVEESSASYII